LVSFLERISEFSPSKESSLGWGSPDLLFNGYLRLFHPRVKQLEHEVNCSSPYSDRVNNAWNYSVIPPYALMELCLSKCRNDFTLPLTHNKM
jgi:hypothetical protein